MLETKVAEMLGQLADKLGVASAKIWEWSLLQVKVEIIQNLIMFVLAIGLTFALVRWGFYIKRNWKELDSKNYEISHMLLIGVAVVFVAILDVNSCIGIYQLPQLIINPEYAAFQNIIEQLGQLK